MSVYAVERFRQVMDLLEMKTIEPLISNSELCQKVESWLCDEASRDAYRRELVFKPLYQITRNESLAVQIAGNMSSETWRQALQAAQKGLADGSIPDLETKNCEGYWRLYMFAATYIIQQYTYNDLVTVRPGDTVLDCGGCFGDTAIWFAQQNAGKIYSFEPMPDNLGCIHRNIQTMQLADRIIPIQLALGKEPGELTFQQNADNPGASAANATGNVKVQATTIDLWCAENQVQPQFIKMDLEGAEVDTIIGAQNVFRQYKPRFAICLYHNLSDMWNIPSLIKQISPDYQIWCRKNAMVGEFVLYGRHKDDMREEAHQNVEATTSVTAPIVSQH